MSALPPDLTDHVHRQHSFSGGVVLAGLAGVGLAFLFWAVAVGVMA